MKTPCTLVLYLVLTNIGMAAVAFVERPISKGEIARFEYWAKELKDPWLEQSLLKVTRLIHDHNTQKAGVVQEEEVQEIYRSFWEIYISFMGVQATYSGNEVRHARSAIAFISRIAVQETSWVFEQKLIPRELVLARLDIERKAKFFEGCKHSL